LILSILAFFLAPEVVTGARMGILHWGCSLYPNYPAAEVSSILTTGGAKNRKTRPQGVWLFGKWTILRFGKFPKPILEIGDIFFYFRYFPGYYNSS